MLESLIAGQRDPVTLADLAKGSLRRKIPQLIDALEGRFTAHHAFLARTHLDLIDSHDQAIAALTGKIEEAMEPFRLARDLLTTIPGIGRPTADVIIAETGADMTRFPTPAHLASWAGVVPGNNESAGKVRSTKTRPGNKHLQGALGACMTSIAKTDTFLGARHRRLTRRRGALRANVATQHALLVIAWNMLTNGTLYEDLGTDYHDRRHPQQTRNRAIRQLQELGYKVTLEPAA